MHYPTLPAKTLCSIPSTHLQGFRNYIATILKSYLRGMSIILLGLLCAVQRSVCMSCYMLYRHVLLFSFTNCRRHSCCQGLVTSRPFFIVRICSSAGVVTVLSRVLTVGATLFSIVLLFKPPCY